MRCKKAGQGGPEANRRAAPPFSHSNPIPSRELPGRNQSRARFTSEQERGSGGQVGGVFLLTKEGLADLSRLLAPLTRTQLNADIQTPKEERKGPKQGPARTQEGLARVPNRARLLAPRRCLAPDALKYARQKHLRDRGLAGHGVQRSEIESGALGGGGRGGRGRFPGVPGAGVKKKRPPFTLRSSERANVPSSALRYTERTREQAGMRKAD